MAQRQEARAGFLGWLLGKRPGPAEPAPVAPAAPRPSMSTSAPACARKRRAAPGEWNPELPQGARMWAIVAAEYGRAARETIAGARKWCAVCARRSCVCNVAVLGEILRDAAALGRGGAAIVGVRGTVHQLELERRAPRRL